MRGLDDYLTSSPWERRGKAGNGSSSITLYRYDDATGSEVEMEVEVSGTVGPGYVEDVEIIQPIGPQFEVTQDDIEAAAVALQEDWEDRDDDREHYGSED